MSTIPPDPGMAVKMAPPAPDMSRALAGQVTPQGLEDILAFIDERIDCADFRMISILALLYGGDHIDPVLIERMKRSVLGFKYWMDEPGDDGMCQWSENHQALFSVSEYLAGQLYPDEVFTNGGYTGRERMARGEARIRRWLCHRFRFGFTEWCSNTYYEEDVAPLALLIEHSADPDLVERARMVLDLLLLDMALHRYRGRFVGTSGRCYEAQKKNPDVADVNDVMAHAFGTPEESPPPQLGRIGAIFILSQRYATPEAIRAIARQTGSHEIKESTGLDVAEVAQHFRVPNDPDTIGAFYWLMEAFTNAESISTTVTTFNQWEMRENRFLAPLAPLAKAAAHPVVRITKPLPLLVRLLNPATQGVAIQRANIYAYRTDAYHLSSAQSYHAGEFGDQQHIWQATLPRDITVFATHPGAPMFDSNVRNFSPSYWVGNGKNPEVGQHTDHLVALYDIRGRRGLLEKQRQQFTHLWLPTEKFDRVEVGEDWIAAQVEDTYLGIRTLRPITQVTESEFTQAGKITGYGVVLATTHEHASFDDFQAFVQRSALQRTDGALAFYTASKRLQVRWRRGLWVNGIQRPHQFPRYDTPWVSADREPTRFVVECDGHRLELDWDAGTRRESSC